MNLFAAECQNLNLCRRFRNNRDKLCQMVLWVGAVALAVNLYRSFKLADAGKATNFSGRREIIQTLLMAGQLVS